MTLNSIEHKILRKKYKDPRIHFAINCASNSCPPIGNRIVTGNDLDSQLEKKLLISSMIRRTFELIMLIK